MTGVRFLAGAALALAAAAPATLSFRSGVYTDAQADRGLRLYVRNCASCHGDMLNGSESGPTLTDEQFLGQWRGKPLADLYDKMRQTMPPPPDQPGRLSEQEYADILAAVLRMNEAPAGKAELTADRATLGRTLVE